MRNSSFHTKPYNEYYQQHTNSSYGLQSRRTTKKLNISQSKVSQGKSKFEDRLEKACTTNAPQALKKEIALLKREIQRLQKENLKKDNHIFEIKSNYAETKQKQTELQEIYRIIYYYEGKMLELEKQIKKMDKKLIQNIDKSLDPQTIESMIAEYRDQNIELKGTLEEQNRLIMEMEEKLRKVESKYFQTSWKLSNQKRIEANPLKKKFPKLRNTIVINDVPLAEKERMIEEMQSRQMNLNQLNAAEVRSERSLKINTTPTRKIYNQKQQQSPRISGHIDQNNYLSSREHSGNFLSNTQQREVLKPAADYRKADKISGINTNKNTPILRKVNSYQNPINLEQSRNSSNSKLYSVHPRAEQTVRTLGNTVDFTQRVNNRQSLPREVPREFQNEASNYSIGRNSNSRHLVIKGSRNNDLETPSNARNAESRYSRYSDSKNNISSSSAQYIHVQQDREFNY